MSNRTCTIEGCEMPARCLSLCDKHYTRLRRHGDPLKSLRVPSGTTDDEVRLRFYGWDEVLLHPDLGACWEWRGGKSPSGYGLMMVSSGRNQTASRTAYEVWVGPLGRSLDVCHKCDNPPCINPGHLFLGDRGVNMKDAAAKNRIQHGDRSGRRKLCQSEVDEIRKLYAAGVGDQFFLAQKFGVSQSNVSFIVKGKTWVRSFNSDA